MSWFWLIPPTEPFQIDSTLTAIWPLRLDGPRILLQLLLQQRPEVLNFRRIDQQVRVVEVLDDEMAASLVEGDDELLGRCIAGLGNFAVISTYKLTLAWLNDS